MKLELKHLAGYLPNGLKGILIEDKTSIFNEENYFEPDKFQCGSVWELVGANDTEDLNIPLGEGYLYGFLWKNEFTYVNFHRGILPILRPLSDITKEIDFKYEDSNGILITYPEKISVMQYLNIAKSNLHKYRPRLNRFEYALGNGTVSYNFDVNGQLMMPYDIVRLFFINHFDIHRLIEKGLAIDINTLNL